MTCSNLRKSPGRAKILASAIVTFKDQEPAKIVFVRDRRKTDWLALLSTDIHLSDEDVVRIYGKRWDIEVLFKMAKQQLKLAKEIQCRDFDALIAHTTLVFIRYQFIAYCIRMESDHRSFGDLFYACCDELSDISFVEALHRLLTLAMEQLREMSTFCEQTASAFFNTVMQVALKYFNLAMSSMAKSEIQSRKLSLVLERKVHPKATTVKSSKTLIFLRSGVQKSCFCLLLQQQGF